MHSTTSRTESAALSLAERVGPASLAILVGLFLVLGVGLAHPDLIHSAAHDARHAFAFPCH